MGEIMRKILWNLFIKTGRLNYYLLFRKLQEGVMEHGNNQSRRNSTNDN
jgi:hypothetical protein